MKVLLRLTLVPEDLAMAIATARAESKAAFNDDAIYLEKHLARPRHIELQVLGDGRGHAIHLGERDCSLQRRYQKVWEEGPCPALNEAARSAIGDVPVIGSIPWLETIDRQMLRRVFEQHFDRNAL